MASKPAELPLFTWAPPESPLRVEYSGGVMEEIRARAVNGFYKIRGGVDVAGLLIGTVQPESIRILAQLPFDIEYAQGPAFALSLRDLALVRKLIEEASARGLEAQDSHGVQRVLGLYISHARSGLTISPSEAQRIDELFPHAWQTVLLLKPSYAAETAAAFFVRESSGEIRTDRSYGEFTVSPAMGQPRARPARRDAASLHALAEATGHGSEAEPAATSPPPMRELQGRDAPRREPEAREPRALSGPSPAAPPEAPLPPRLREDELLARRALSERPPAQPAPPSPEAAERAFAAAPEAPLAKLRDIERVALPGPLATLHSETDAVRERMTPEAAASTTEAAGSAAAWHEEEVAADGVRATHWLRWAIPSVAFVLLLILGFLVYHAFNDVAPSVVFFRRSAGDGQEVVWRIQGVSNAQSAVISIKNGAQTHTIDLIRTGQLSGVYRDPSLASASAVTIDIERSNGEKIHREAPPLAADSVVPYLGGFTDAESTGAESAAVSVSASADAARNAEQRLAPAPILATPVPLSPEHDDTKLLAARSSSPSSAGQPASMLPPPAALPAPEAMRAAAVKPTPESPVQARITEAPPEPHPVNGAAVSAPAPSPIASAAPSPPVVAPPRTVQPFIIENRPASQLPAVSPAAPSEPPLPHPSAVAPPPVQPSAAVKAAPALPAAGRVIWTGQLNKNQSVRIDGGTATTGNVNGLLPGRRIRVNVFPGELAPHGVVAFTADPRYRNTEKTAGSSGSENGQGGVQYRYDPARFRSVIATEVPNAANGWRGITVRNGSKNIDAIVIEWKVEEP